MHPYLSEFADLPVIDCHVHFDDWRNNANLKRMAEFMVRVAEEGRLNKIYVTGGDAGIYLKLKYPGLFYAGGFVPWSGGTGSMPNVNWDNYIRSLIEAGFDGVGEMGSKPVPKRIHVPLNSGYYEGFWGACESYGFPVLYHVADPEEFWDENLAPEWAKKRGWVYYGGDYPLKEELYREMEDVLDRHPRLKIVLYHFYFMSANLEEAADFLNRHKNANLDLTPGIELIYNISRRRDDWRDFFIKYQDRIFFGTDIATWQTEVEAVARIWIVRKFLESDEEFFTPETADELLTRYKEPFIGLKLPVNTLRKIYSENFKRLWGKQPRKANVDTAMRFFEERGEKELIEIMKSNF
ncbi:MAG: amidohydrolase family protein [Candidatus Bathyarchaeia archaeon]